MPGAATRSWQCAASSIAARRLFPDLFLQLLGLFVSSELLLLRRLAFFGLCFFGDDPDYGTRSRPRDGVTSAAPIRPVAFVQRPTLDNDWVRQKGFLRRKGWG